MTVKVGSKWRGTDSVKFYVLDVVSIENQTWVCYNNDNGQDFKCLEPAFLSRFTEYTNESRTVQRLGTQDVARQSL